MQIPLPSGPQALPNWCRLKKRVGSLTQGLQIRPFGHQFPRWSGEELQEWTGNHLGCFGN